MPPEYFEETAPIKEEPGYIAKLAARLDKKSRAYAQIMHERQLIYWLFSLLDGPQVAWSSLKWIFEVLSANAKVSSTDAMHDWMATPSGIAMTVSEVVAITLFSLLGTVFSDSDPNIIKRHIAQLWPYFRDLTKIKNPWKGVKTLLAIMKPLGGADVNFLLLPLFLPIGTIAITNRLWFRYVKNLRIAMMKANAELLAIIQRYDTLTAEECAAFRLKMKKNTQSTTVRAMGLLSQLVSGAIDSLYLYVGVLMLCSVVWPALVVMVLFCAVYSVVCVITRMYEEYDYQRKLLITHAKIELNLYSKEFGSDMHECFSRLHRISKLLAVGCSDEEFLDELLDEQYWLAKDIAEKIKTFNDKRAHLQSLLLLSHFSAFLAGAKNGLAAYGAVASVMFAISTILLLTSTAFPPALLIAGISSGLVLLVGFIAHSMIRNYRHRVKQEKESHKSCGRLSDLLQVLKDVKSNNVDEISEAEVKQLMIKSMDVPPPPQSSAPEWSEVWRSLASGPGKVIRLLHQILAPWRKMDDAGKFHDTPAVIIIIMIFSFLESIVLAARALARGFGRPAVDKAPPAVNHASSSCSESSESCFEGMDSETPYAPSFSEDFTSFKKTEEPSDSTKKKSAFTADEPDTSFKKAGFDSSSGKTDLNAGVGVSPEFASSASKDPTATKHRSASWNSLSFFNTAAKKTSRPQEGFARPEFPHEGVGLAM